MIQTYQSTQNCQRHLNLLHKALSNSFKVRYDGPGASDFLNGRARLKPSHCIERCSKNHKGQSEQNLHVGSRSGAVPNVFHIKHLKQAGLGVIFNKAENATMDEMQLFRSTCAVLPSGSKGSLRIAGWAVHKFNPWINGYAGDKNTPGCRHTGLGPANSSSQDRMGQQCKSRLTDQPTAPSGGWQRDRRGRHRERQQAPYLDSRTSRVMR